jgi:hypothetical protein
MTQVRLKRQTSAGGRFWVEGAPVDPNATRQSVGLKHTVTKTAYDREHKLDYVILQKVMDEMVAAFEVRADDASDLLRWAENDSKNVVMITHKTHKTFVTIRSTTKITDSQRRRAKNIIKRAKINRTLYGGSITAMHNAEILRIGDPAHTEWDDIKKEWVDV